MNIRIEGTHENLKELHKLIYEADNNLEIDEDYESTPGMQREPIVIALIGTLSSIVVLVIKKWASNQVDKRAYESRKNEIDLERDKAKMKYNLEKTKIILDYKGKSQTELSIDQIDKLDDYLYEK